MQRNGSPAAIATELHIVKEFSMDPSPKDFVELTGWLSEQGYSESQIRAILECVKQYDQDTKLLSSLDSIENDSFGLTGVIDQVLSDVGKPERGEQH